MVGLHPNVVFDLAPALTAIHPVLVPPRNGGSGTAGARLLAAVALAACCLPARRATRID
jgi:hypothetical protein